MASRGINKVILVGNLGNDPDVRYTQSGAAIANLSIATSESWMDKNTGQQQSKTEWHRVIVFGKLAEIAQQYLQKGAKVYIEGKLQTRKWQAQDGSDRYATEVIVDGFSGQMQMLDSQHNSGAQNQNQAPQQQWMKTQAPQNQQYQQQATQAPQQNTYAQARNNPPQPQQQKPYQGANDFDDDIPF